MTRHSDVDHRPPLGSQRLLGVGAGAALISPTAEIGWWCRDQFDSEPVLWQLLDRIGSSARWRGAEIGTWNAQPAGPTAKSTIRIGNRRLSTWDGLIVHHGRSVLIRLIKADDGEPFEVVHELSVGGFEATIQQWTTSAGTATTGVLSVAGGQSISPTSSRLDTSVIPAHDRWSGFAIVDATNDERFDDNELVQLMDAAEDDEASFLDHVQLPRDHPSRAIDALRVLRALTDRESGAPVAAPTTSLPEAPGAERQFDYRYTWLRDAAHSVATASLLGRPQAASRYLDFVATLLERCDGHLEPMTTTRGGPVPAERQIKGVNGWAASIPVRVGNNATGQKQLDSISALIDAISTHLGCGGKLTSEIWSVVDRLATMLATAPFEATSGVWELREPARLVTDELARWIGLDAAKRIRRLRRPWVRRPLWATARNDARTRVEAALDPASGMLPQSFDGPFVADASTLLAAIHGFYPRRSKQAKRLVHATIAALEEGPFLRRYPAGSDGADSIEGAFIPASWWAVTALAAIGDLDEAARRADEMCLHLPPLQPEEWAVAANEALGNTPLLWSHTEAARALFHLHHARIRRHGGPAAYAFWRLLRYLRVRFIPA